MCGLNLPECSSAIASRTLISSNRGRSFTGQWNFRLSVAVKRGPLKGIRWSVSAKVMAGTFSNGGPASTETHEGLLEDR